ncbi:unnamed protein product, partial [Adineta steineri]
FNADGTRRPFSSDSPLPPPLIPHSSTAVTYISSAPPVHNRTTYQPVEPLKLASEQEDNSIAALSRELRAAAYPTTCKSSNHSPTRETSPSTTRYSTRSNSKRGPLPPRSLPKLHPNEQQTTISNTKISHYHHPHPHPPPAHHQQHEVEKQEEDGGREQPPVLLLRTPSLSNPTEDATLSFVSKFARLAPIIPSHSTNGNTSILSPADENN